MRQRVEQFFRELEERIDKEIEAFTVEWRQYEALGQIQLREDFFVFIVFSWSDEECSIEFMLGDENAVIQPRHLDKLDVATSIIKQAFALAKERFTCL
ncbi:hypothetical protein [Pyrobaculum aerophilum]|uniref:Uncharacterized protein n=2 Tax=Pyrobaculum aerophilum TaxID=13773 RepID=Q8ZWR1_PYRAE|nr:MULTISPECIES: hypothetical protein [Pyrobaculum]AAL63639.1 hypothetical protein PAE1663 [Pyrobaculum aerophilum str. IM2]MCX8137841.1 hypothetical protein [Pyrobaculum aerophilum]RFA96851.1 hypothetical protein CGL51_04000 [Pyrobaculum aerophilum]RFA97117.1 hypothetical protein CGL52_10015 [Pyrobaculum aerophilum]HII46833.1 hypothetical protein [Pyrobaculum aerophilum]